MNDLLAFLPRFLALGAAMLTGQPAFAQTVPRFGEAAMSSISRTAGLHLVDGQLWGAGDTYKVRFDTQGFLFTPALGGGAPRNYPLAFQLESIGRGSAVSPLAAAAPTFRDLRVEYDRGAVIERYDVGVGVLEQSFVFHTRPAGTGDLVVRGRLTTDLAVSEEGDGLRFTLPGVGGFHMGGVVGIDAQGDRARGRVRYAGGVVELSLPAAFVDHAALPLVLDPPFGNAFVISGTGGSDDEGPSVAYDASNDVFLVVWKRIFSTTDHDVYAHRVSRAAQPVGTTVFIDTSTTLETEPQVANCSARNAFVVVYNRAGDIRVRAVNAATGLPAGGTVIAGGASNQHFGCVAGDLNNSHVVCVWQSDADLALQSCRVTVNADLTLTPSSVRNMVLSTTFKRPRMSKSDRGTGRHAVTFQAAFTNGIFNAFTMIIDSNGAPISQILGAPSQGALEALPEVDGDGSNWIVAWQSQSTTPIIQGASYSFDPISGLVQNAFNRGITLFGFENCLEPSVTWIGDSCLVGYSRATSAGREARAHSLDPFNCIDCEGIFSVGLSTRVEGRPSGCSVQADGGTGEDVLLAWEQSVAGNGDIIVRRWQTVDGTVTSLGGGCGRGGSSRATCARSPNPRFAHHLRDALPSAPAVFVFSPGQLGFPCGPCNLVPDLASAIILLLGTDGLGRASLPVAISPASSLIGVPFFTQWATVDVTAPACTLFSLHLSNALRIVIQ